MLRYPQVMINVPLSDRGAAVDAEAVERAKQVFQYLEGTIKSGVPVRNREFAYALNVARHDGTEMVAMQWLRPSEALARSDSLKLMGPTRATLSAIARFDSAQALMDWARLPPLPRLLRRQPGRPHQFPVRRVPDRRLRRGEL